MVQSNTQARVKKAKSLSQRLDERAKKIRYVARNMDELSNTSDELNRLVSNNERFEIAREDSTEAYRDAELRRGDAGYGILTNFDKLEILRSFAENGEDPLAVKICQYLDDKHGEFRDYDKICTLNTSSINVASRLMSRSLTQDEYFGLLSGTIRMGWDIESHEPLYLKGDGK